jgi:hypothetical protein
MLASLPPTGDSDGFAAYTAVTRFSWRGDAVRGSGGLSLAIRLTNGQRAK